MQLLALGVGRAVAVGELEPGLLQPLARPAERLLRNPDSVLLQLLRPFVVPHLPLRLLLHLVLEPALPELLQRASAQLLEQPSQTVPAVSCVLTE